MKKYKYHIDISHSEEIDTEGKFLIYWMFSLNTNMDIWAIPTKNDFEKIWKYWDITSCLAGNMKLFSRILLCGWQTDSIIVRQSFVFWSLRINQSYWQLYCHFVLSGDIFQLFIHKLRREFVTLASNSTFIPPLIVHIIIW